MTDRASETAPGALIVGAGPAGLMAADAVAAAGFPVLICDASPSPARKMLMAGASGLNLTHAEPLETFLTRYAPPEPLLLDAVRRFPPQATRDFCDGLGQKTFVGSSGKVFPDSMKASPLLRAWLARLELAGVRLRRRWRFSGFDGDGGALRFSTPEGERRVAAAATVFAFGGASWPRLGADGGWRPAFVEAGFAVAPFAPSNCGLKADWPADFLSRFEGAPLKPVALACAGVVARGEIVVTAKGLEGAPVYRLSPQFRAAGPGPFHVEIDFRPDLAAEALAGRLARGRTGDSLANRLRKAGLGDAARALLRLDGRPLEPGAAALAARIKAARLTFQGVDSLERAISSAGGLAFDELAPDFSLRRRPDFFACGEMLDWDAPTGGYLIQACLSTGRRAGEGAAARLRARRTDL